MACKKDYRGELIRIKETKGEVFYCPVTRQKCSNCEYLGEDTLYRVHMFKCLLPGRGLEFIYTEEDGFSCFREIFCGKTTKRKCCMDCKHYGDCLVNTIEKEDNPYADLCELAELID